MLYIWSLNGFHIPGCYYHGKPQWTAGVFQADMAGGVKGTSFVNNKLCVRQTFCLCGTMWVSNSIICFNNFNVTFSKYMKLK